MAVDKTFGVVSYAIVGGSGVSPRKCLYFSTPVGLHFVRFLKQIFAGYPSLHYTVDRVNLQLSILAWYVYVYAILLEINF